MKKILFRDVKKKRGYLDMRMLLRRSNVNFKSQGIPLLEIAIMSYLEKPKTEEEIMEILSENSPIMISSIESVKELILDAIQNVHTRKSEKIYQEGILMTFISNIANEIRISNVIQIQTEETGDFLKMHEKEFLIQLCMRRLNKPNDTFLEVLNHVAGRMQCDDIKSVIESREEFNTKMLLDERILVIKNFVDEILAEKDKLVF